MLLPSHFNLDAPGWRPHQYETVQWARAPKRDAQGVYVAQINEAPTGSGKSLTALAAGHGTTQTVVLTHTRALQSQYESSYSGCEVLFGRNNYPCLEPSFPAHVSPTAQDCLFPGKPSDCTEYYSCPYHVQKRVTTEAERAVLNYAYWLITNKRWAPDLLVCDEGHNIPDIILDHVGTTINEVTRANWQLPPFPVIDSSSVSGLFQNAAHYIAPSDAAYNWLSQSAAIMHQIKRTLENELNGYVNQRKLFQKRAAENLYNRLQTCATALETTPGEHWYINSGPGVSYYQGQVVPGFNCKPLTARYDFQRFCAATEKRRVLIMSATIGKEDVFARELGLSEYDFQRTPAVWPAETRPVHILPAPAMSRAAANKDPGIWDKQADVIAKAIRSLPNTWSGIILVSRKAEATLLAKRLSQRGLGLRMWVPPGADANEYKPTNEQLSAWLEQLQAVPNSIAVAWSFWEGVDAKDSQILICAKIPFQFRGDQYEMAREQYDHAFASQRVAWQLEQGLGRVRRGDPSDYNSPKEGIIRTYVAIADASWIKIKKYLSPSMLESIVID